MNAIAVYFATERFQRCPVCGRWESGAVGSAETNRHARSYLCGAVFERIDGFFACTHPCPSPSVVASNHIVQEARRAA
ncbi:hypothetical protein [Martelella radicis]|uniref:Uncharacterized protein n=1 Tax=Martelella radicis TaxID=1397476 RepID=A0A7W6KKD3_9HYPH|nr:hypothetical protein [Martelella radicis]MBB4122939.1 hypothetical protein [Martelella radicis]